MSPAQLLRAAFVPSQLIQSPCDHCAAAQVLLFLKPEGIDELVPSIRSACLQPAAVLRGQWARLLWAPLLHADSLHLYYNMSSLLWKVGAGC